MRLSLRVGTFVVAGLAAVLAMGLPAPQPTPREKPEADRDREAAVGPDRIGPELEKRIRGQAKLDDVRVEVIWPRGGTSTVARVYGNGVGIWNRRRQFRMSRARVISMLETLREARFGSMPDRFGESEEDERNEGPRLKGRIAVRAGWVSKTVIQLVDGEQSAEFASLAERLLTICERPARKGVEAASLSDGLKKLASGELAPETLQVTVQRRFAKPDIEAGQAGWILQLEGRRVLAEVLPAGKTIVPDTLLVLSDAEFHGLAQLLADNHAGEIPINVYAPEYTDIQLGVLRWSRAISGRRFLNLTPETHGEKQRSFDRLYEAFKALYEHARRDGTAVPSSVAPPPVPEKENEAEREREKEKKS
jgi:hypothetical protein